MVLLVDFLKWLQSRAGAEFKMCSAPDNGSAGMGCRCCRHQMKTPANDSSAVLPSL